MRDVVAERLGSSVIVTTRDILDLLWRLRRWRTATRLGDAAFRLELNGDHGGAGEYAMLPPKDLARWCWRHWTWHSGFAVAEAKVENSSAIHDCAHLKTQ